MLLNVIGYVGLGILGIVTLVLIFIIRKRVYVQFYLSFSSLISTASFVYLIFSQSNYLYSWLALFGAYASVWIIALFARFGFNFVNSIISFVSGIYREIILIGIPENEIQKRIAQEKERTQEYWNEIARETADKYKTNDEKISELVGYTYSFVYSNTQALEDYGSENGYIPSNYINDFKKAFSKTIQNVENIKNEYLEKLSDENKKAISEELEKFKEGNAQEAKQMWEDSYVRNTGKEKSRKEFLIDVEACKDTIIQNHIRTFKRSYPSVFKD